MKKIPTLFVREFENHRVVKVLPEVTPGFEWVLRGEGTPTVKIDGACCAIIDGKFYKRYDAKKDKRGNLKIPPSGAIPCCDPDPVTGHWPHWVLVDENDPADKWFVEARNSMIRPLPVRMESRKIFWFAMARKSSATWTEASKASASICMTTWSRASYSGRTASPSAKSSGLISASNGPSRTEVIPDG